MRQPNLDLYRNVLSTQTLPSRLAQERQGWGVNHRLNKAHHVRRMKPGFHQLRNINWMLNHGDRDFLRLELMFKSSKYNSMPLNQPMDTCSVPSLYNRVQETGWESSRSKSETFMILFKPPLKLYPYLPANYNIYGNFDQKG